MNIDVYDTYAVYGDGESLHFDVFLQAGTDASEAEQAAKQWLNEISLEGESAQLSSSRFCHSEPASPEVCDSIRARGFAILPL